LSVRSNPSPSPTATAAPRGGVAVSLHGVVKQFGSVVAVNGLDLEVSAGLCFGLLGPNGAGKSTTMRILTGQAVADRGSIEVLGHRLPAESKLARARMGVCPQESDLDVDLGVRDVLEVFARLYRVPSHERAAAVDRALALSGLEQRANDRAVDLSGGMQRRLLIARTLIHGPELVLLDEPTVGLDPQIRQELWSLIVALRDGGATVLMSTHYIEEAERLADRVAIMAAGRVVAEGSPGELIRAHAGREVVDVQGSAAELSRLRSEAEANGLPTRRSGPALTYLHADSLDGRVPAGGRRSATLEDVFVRLTGDYVE
jgi:lipooligosaccharide transport system ATP-binding protein